ncbi:MAG TPA: hypothetical protein VGH09_09235 [Solirubrobacteraceae bacterium]
MDAVGFWPRCNTTAGRFAVGRAGAGSSVSPLGVAGVDVVPAGAVVDGAGVDSLVVGAGVEVVVVGCGEGGGASWVVVGSVVVPVVVCVPSPVDVFGSAAIAPVEIGPKAVRPPPASADKSARQARLRRVPAAVMRRLRSSSGRPMVVSARPGHKTRGTPAGIHIGRQPRARKGFVIASTSVHARQPVYRAAGA